MIVVPASVKLHLALSLTDMRKGLDGLATLIQEQLKRDTFCGPSVRLPRQECFASEYPVWDGTGLCACSPSASIMEAFVGPEWRTLAAR
jgi:transposase